MQLDHVGVAVEDTDDALAFYRDVLGLEPGFESEFEGNRVTYLDGGETRVELLEPLEDNALARQLDERGEGLHHLAVRVDDLEAELDRLRDADVELVDDAPRPGAGDARMAFVHPRAASGVLVQLYEP